MPVPQKRSDIIQKLTVAAAVLLIIWPHEGHAAMEISPRVSAGAEYTDNVRLVPDNTESDTIFTVTPGITVDITGRPAGLTLIYDPSFVTYADDSYDDYWRHQASAAGWWQPVKSTRFELTDTYLKTEDPISDDDLTVRRTRNPYTRNTAAVSVEQRFGSENVATAKFEHSMLENEDPLVDDSETYVPSLGLTYWLNVQWGFDFSGVFTRAKYDVPAPAWPEDFDDLYGSLRLLHRFNRHTTGFLGYAHTTHNYEYSDQDLLLDDYTIHDAFAGFDYNIDPTTFLSLSVHYFIRDIEDGSDDDGTPINLDLTKTFERGSVALNAGGGYNYTTVSAENLGYYVYYGGGLSADYAFTRRISTDVSARYEWRDYRDVPLGREDDVFRAGCGLSVELLRWLGPCVSVINTEPMNPPMTKTTTKKTACPCCLRWSRSNHIESNDKRRNDALYRSV
jgi:hypothetical protein